MSLAELQRDFQSWLIEGSDDAAQRINGATSAGLAVYQNNYRAQLVGSLENSYPQLLAWVGEEAFLYAAKSHIDANPPHAWTLDAYADDFGDSLLKLFPDNPDIHELAWIERALDTSFVGADAEPVTAAELAEIDWDTARLRLTPTLMSRRATTNASDIWWAMRDGKDKPEGEMLPEARALLVWRRGHVSCLRTIDPLEHEALAHLQEHGSFVALCDLLVERLGEADGVARAGALLADWIGSELITGIEHAE
jgi:hypothetical protein